MKINLENIYSPCEQCLIHGYSYSPNNDRCQSCEYNIAIAILKEVLKSNDFCTLCKNVEHIKGGYTDCKFGLDGSRQCNSYTIDWKAIIKDYQLESTIKI